ncbi:DUF2207 domain-containing protein [Amycolatopsis azurea]|uniref:DUF2207 domain-containing protein n=1 Tax=Amycolatopsis azurea TaxID=36819 RepID=UPI00381E806A
MSSRILGVVAVVAVSVISPLSAHADVEDFTITSFTADYYLGIDQDRRSHLDVTERIVAQFPETDRNHGIERIVPGAYDGHPIGPRIVSVTDGAGSPLTQEIRGAGSDTVVRIGDPGIFVHGTRTYVLRYELRDVVHNGADHDELNWNTSGVHWRTVVGTTVARLHLDAGAAAAYNGDHHCLQGAPDSGEACEMTRTGEGRDLTFSLASSRPMPPGENVSLRFGFRPGTFAPYAEPELEAGTVAVFIVWGALNLVSMVLGTVFLVRLWRRWVSGPASAHVGAPVTVPPGNLGVPMAAMLCGRSDRVFSATVLDLAVRGYLTITDTGQRDEAGRRKIYSLRLERALSGLVPAEIHVARILFGAKPKRGMKTDTKMFPTRLPPHVKILVERLEADQVDLGFARKRAVHRRPYYWCGGGLIALGIVLVSPGILAVGVATCVVTSRFSRLTDLGAEMRDHLLGLREHLAKTWTGKAREPHPERLLDPSLRLLPYAVIFGLDRKWHAVLSPAPPRATAGDGTDLWWRDARTGSDGTFSGSAGGGGGGGKW